MKPPIDESKVDGRFSSHAPILAACVVWADRNFHPDLTDDQVNTVIEIGAGICSTPMLHEMCSDSSNLVHHVYETDPQWSVWAAHVVGHELESIPGFDGWTSDCILAFVDNGPHERDRVPYLIELAEHCPGLVVLHDVGQEWCREPECRAAMELFKYRGLYRAVFGPHTAVLSNHVDVRDEFPSLEPFDDVTVIVPETQRT